MDWTPVVAFFVGTVVAVAMHDCLISFGSNIGNSAEYFQETTRLLNGNSSIASLIASDAISTRAIGGPPGQAEFLNGCLRFRTTLTIECLFGFLRQIEMDFGRERRVRWGGRTIDLDVLLFDDLDFATDELTLPHPRMSFRRFVLQPACQIASDMIHTTSGRSIGQLLEHLDLKPDRITLVSSPASKLDRMKQRILTLCQSAGWQFEIICQSESFESKLRKTKLLVFSNELGPELHRLAARFPGPTLNLGDAEEKHAIIEVRAAIQAMEPL